MKTNRCFFVTMIKVVAISFIVGVLITNYSSTCKADTIIERAHAGDPEAQFLLGGMYVTGDGVKKDNKEAMKWFQKAADQNHIFAQISLGFAYYYGNSAVEQDYQKAITWFEKAAMQENPVAQLYLGLLYVEGKGVEQDYSKALEWFMKAALQGDSKAQMNVGLMYARGLGVNKNLDEAKKWFQKAADQGNTKAKQILEKLEAGP